MPVTLTGPAFTEAGAFRPKAQLEGLRAFQDELQTLLHHRPRPTSSDASSKTSSGGIRYLDENSRRLYEPLIRLRDILTRYEYLTNLPSPSAIYAELAKPFLSDLPQVEACSLALSTMKRICSVYPYPTASELLTRWTWCCHAMMVDNATVRHQATQLLLACTTSYDPARAPKGKLAMQALTFTLIRLLFCLQRPSTNCTEAEIAAPRSIVFSLLNKLSNGSLIAVQEQAEGQTFLDSIIRVIATGESGMRTFASVNILDVCQHGPHHSEEIAY